MRPTSVRAVQVVARRGPVDPGRQGLIWHALSTALDSLSAAPSTELSAAPTVLDCGGGSGSLAVPLAQSGARVTVVDISVDALATLQRRAEEAGVADAVAARQGDVEALGEAVGSERFDLVLAHGVLGSVDSVAGAFAAIAGAVRPGGVLSVVVANPVAAVLARALAGDLDGALAELRALDAAAAGPDAVAALCRDHQFVLEQAYGIGVFSDIVPGRALDVPGALEALEQLESESATRASLREIASRVHLLARRPEA